MCISGNLFSSVCRFILTPQNASRGLIYRVFDLSLEFRCDLLVMNEDAINQASTGFSIYRDPGNP
jgi:hypothetical protein